MVYLFGARMRGVSVSIRASPSEDDDDGDDDGALLVLAVADCLGRGTTASAPSMYMTCISRTVYLATTLLLSTQLISPVYKFLSRPSKVAQAVLVFV